MAEKEWHTVSVRLNQDLRNAMNWFCKRENITPNKFIRDLVEDKLKFITDEDSIPENQGIPEVGENVFKYLPETDQFIWQLDKGDKGITALAENIPSVYLERLNKAIEKSLEKRKQVQDSMKKKKGTVIPKDILKYEVKKNVRQ